MMSLAEMEKFLAVAAYLVVRHGEAYTPTFERLEKEVEAARHRVDQRTRAQRVLSDLMRREVTVASAV